MLFNEFIEIMLKSMSYPIIRLQNPQECLAIQLNLHNDYIYNLVNSIINLIPEYKYNWYKMVYVNANNINNISIINRRINLHNFRFIDKYYEFQELYDYIITNNIFTIEEADWLEDAIHEILVM